MCSSFEMQLVMRLAFCLPEWIHEKKKSIDRVTKPAPIFEETGKKKRRRIGLPEPQFVSFRISILQFAKNFLPHTSKVTDAQVFFSLCILRKVGNLTSFSIEMPQSKAICFIPCLDPCNQMRTALTTNSIPKSDLNRRGVQHDTNGSAEGLWGEGLGELGADNARVT